MHILSNTQMAITGQKPRTHTAHIRKVCRNGATGLSISTRHGYGGNLIFCHLFEIQTNNQDFFAGAKPVDTS